MKISLVLILSLCFWGTGFAQAQATHFDNFKRIPVLDNGRLKPLDTFARNLLTQFSGQDHYENKDIQELERHLI